jgi:hypothetical protein
VTDGGNSLPPSGFSTGTADLFGGRTDGRPRRRGWRIEVEGMTPMPGMATSTELRVTLIDAETGKRVCAQKVPFEWIRDVAWGAISVVAMSEGDYS